MPVFFRLENEKGEGVYTDGAAFTANKLTSSVWHHTPPDVEFPDYFSISPINADKSWFFGFRSLNQLYKWFDTIEAIAYLEMKGISIVEYEVSSRFYHTSESQCIYKQGREKKKGVVPFDYSRLSHCPYENKIKLTRRNIIELEKFISKKNKTNLALEC